jgi:transcriptional regulator with XRE-family HTH domain
MPAVVALRESTMPKSRPPTDEGLRVAAALRTLRRSRGLTQRQVAENWGISLDGYRPWEQGKRRLRVSQLGDVAKALTVSEGDLRRALGMTDDPGPLPPLVERRFSADLESVMREVEELPDDVARRVIRSFKVSLEIADLSRRAPEE